MSSSIHHHNIKLSIMSLINRILLVIFLSGLSFLSHAFGVDVCFIPSVENNIRNCIEVDQGCRTDQLSYFKSIRCRMSALSDAVKGLTRFNKIIGGRSLIHSDSTYFLAQMLGFSPWQAYQMMIYDEATDQSKYIPFDQAGHLLLSKQEMTSCRDHWGPKMPKKCLIITPFVRGIGKFSPSTGGSFLHLHARYRVKNKTLAPLPYPSPYVKTDHLLANFYAWIYQKRDDACIAGITRHMSRLDSPCAPETEKLISPVDIAMFGFYKMTYQLVTHLGPLIIEKQAQNTVYANDKSFQTYITPHDVTMAKFGIFLHALADRFSHHLCIDHSYFDLTKKETYQTHFSRQYCAQGSHFLWHVWEQGTNQSPQNLDAHHRNIRPALEAVYDELATYARHLGILRNNPQVDKQQLIDELVDVLQIENSTDRLNAMVALMERHHTLALPGHGREQGEQIEDWIKKAQVVL